MHAGDECDLNKTFIKIKPQFKQKPKKWPTPTCHGLRELVGASGVGVIRGALRVSDRRMPADAASARRQRVRRVVTCERVVQEVGGQLRRVALEAVAEVLRRLLLAHARASVAEPDLRGEILN